MAKTKLYITTLILILAQQLCWAQVQMRVQGSVTNISTGDPIANATILDGVTVLGTSDDYGKFSLILDSETDITFYHDKYATTTIKLGGQQELNVMMKVRMIEIDKVVVVGKRSKKQVSVEKTDIIVTGDYFHLNTKFFLPTKIFDSDSRFILQPTIYNITREKRQILSPVVVDGKSYTTVQHRHLNFEDVADPLRSYVIPRNTIRDGQPYIYKDSLKVDPRFRDDDYRVDCYMVIGEYRPPMIYSDTVTIAKGVRNDLRFFTYDFAPLRLDGVEMDVDSERDLTSELMNDTTNSPSLDLDLFDTRGVVNISYVINTSHIDTNNAENKRYLNEISTVLRDIQSNVDATLQSISVTGYSSPDGSYEVNKRLAAERTHSLFTEIEKDIKPEVLPHITLQENSVVARWSDLIDVIASEDITLAERVKEKVETYNDDYSSTSWALREFVPEYRGVISKKYLPRLRRAEYSVEYSVYRENTIEEITEQYHKGDTLSPYNYYKLIRHESDIDKVVEMEQRAIRIYPRFTWLANRISVRNLVSDSLNLETLQPALSKDSPPAMIYNQALTALRLKEYSLADSLMSYVPDERLVQEVDATINLFTENDYTSALSSMVKQGSLNEIILIMALEEYGRASELLKVYFEDPEHQKSGVAWYLYSTCASKLDDVMGAINHLRHAFLLDPSLAEVAAVDSNITDIYVIVKEVIKHNDTVSR